MDLDSTDRRQQLIVADQLVRDGRYATAIALYERVAMAYFQLGFALKGLAVAKTIVSVADQHQLVDRAAFALRLLLDGYHQLGLDVEAADIRHRYRDVLSRS